MNNDDILFISKIEIVEIYNNTAVFLVLVDVQYSCNIIYCVSVAVPLSYYVVKTTTTTSQLGDESKEAVVHIINLYHAHESDTNFECSRIFDF